MKQPCFSKNLRVQTGNSAQFIDHLTDRRLKLKPNVCRSLVALAAFLSIVAGASGCSSSQKKEPAAAASFPAAKIPLEDFFRNSVKTAFEISPDGKWISYLAPWKGRMNVFVHPLGNKEAAAQITEITDRDVAGYFWKSSGTIIYERDFSGDENYQLFSVDVNTKKTVALTPFPGVRSMVIDDLDQIDDNHVLVGLNKRNPEIFDAYRLDIHTGKLKMIAENPGKVDSWITDHKGRLRLAVATDGSNHSIFVRDSEKEKFHVLLSTNFRESVSPLFYTFDNKNVYASSNRGRDKEALVTLDLKTGKESVFFANPDVDVSDLSFSKKRHVLWTAVYRTAKLERHFFDQEIEQIFNQLKSALPNLEVGIVGNDHQEQHFLVRASSDVTRGSYFIYDAEKKTIEKLADLAPWIRSDLMSEMTPIEFSSRDGLLIHGYLTIPTGVEAKNLPVVVNPHGGPWARDNWGFNPEVQFLASRGYAVLQLNFRGSTGYGRKFWEASFKQWGLNMQNDISDGVAWMIKRKIADPQRVAIYGGSYGGYATLAGLAFTPELYKCGVDYVGVSNLLTFMKTVPPYWKNYLSQMYEEVGNPETEADLLKAASPVFHADRIRAPLFVAQGAKDPRVNINESNQIVEALKKRGIAVQYMVKENEGHGFHNEENRFDFYRAMEKFLAEHL